MQLTVRRIGLALAAAMGLTASAHAAESVNFILNWIAGGDHAPYYYAKKMGLYAEAGIDLDIEQGKGSSMSSQRTGIGKNPIGLADLGTALVTRGKGADLVAVMNVYANSPYGMYWLKSSGIGGPADLAGHKIGNPPWDAARQMWPALAKGETVARPEPYVVGVFSSVAVIDGNWKYVEAMARRGGDPGTHLFRLDTDPVEQNDLAMAHPEKLAELAAHLREFPRAPTVAPDVVPPGPRRRGPRGQAPGKGARRQPGRGGGNVSGWNEITRPPWVEAARRD